MAAWLLSSGVAMCVESCRLATWCGETHCNGCMNAAWGLCWGGSRSTNLVFFCVKWLQPAMKGTLCVRRVRLGSFRTQWVPPLCSATSGCSCVPSSLCVLNLLLQIAVDSRADAHRRLRRITWPSISCIASVWEPASKIYFLCLVEHINGIDEVELCWRFAVFFGGQVGKVCSRKLSWRVFPKNFC